MNIVNMPEFTAEASVYKTPRFYRGYSRTGDMDGSVFAPATNCTSSSTPSGCTDDCTIRCFLWWCWTSSCTRTCCRQVSPDQILCGVQDFDGPCPAAPPPPPPPPPPPGCCPPGKRCCGSCETGRCDDVCIGPGQQCP
jgi:hypothetical protein